MPGYVADNWWGLAAPAGLPRPLLDKLYTGKPGSVEIARSCSAQFEREGAAPVDDDNGRSLATTSKPEIAKWGRASSKRGNIHRAIAAWRLRGQAPHRR